MGSLISTCLYSSKERSSSVTPVISTYGILMPVETSIQISRELNPAPMSSPISRWTEITSTGVNFRSMEDLQEEVSRRLMTHVRRH
uniref:C4 protein n=1 Tax=Sesame curly top virus TaxID=2487726 RepID=A0A3S5H8E2_9GEMI|nr:C4 protein [Sesame curly top virus]